MSVVHQLSEGLLHTLFAVLVAAATPFALWDVWFGLRTRRWPRTTGRLVSSYLQKDLSSETGEVHIPYVEYEYHVDGVAYRSRRIAFRTLSDFGSRASFEALIAQRPLVIYYDPSKPLRSVLLPGCGPIEVATLLAAVVIAGLFAFSRLA